MGRWLWGATLRAALSPTARSGCDGSALAVAAGSAALRWRAAERGRWAATHNRRSLVIYCFCFTPTDASVQAVAPLPPPAVLGNAPLLDHHPSMCVLFVQPRLPPL